MLKGRNASLTRPSDRWLPIQSRGVYHRLHICESREKVNSGGDLSSFADVSHNLRNGGLFRPFVLVDIAEVIAGFVDVLNDLIIVKVVRIAQGVNFFSEVAQAHPDGEKLGQKLLRRRNYAVAEA